MSRGPYPGWSLVEDGYLDEPEPVVPEPPRRFGCLSFAVLLLVLVAGVPTSSEARTLAASPAESGLRGAPVDPAVPQLVEARNVPEVTGSNPVRGANAGTPTRSGTWAYAERSYGPGYLAIPEGPGWVVTVCGPLGCIERLSTDAGPALYLQRAGRIGDLAAVMFEEVCGPLSAGLCRGSYTIVGRPDQHPDDPPEHPDDARMRAEDFGPLPATDVAP